MRSKARTEESLSQIIQLVTQHSFRSPSISAIIDAVDRVEKSEATELAASLRARDLRSLMASMSTYAGRYQQREHIEKYCPLISAVVKKLDAGELANRLLGRVAEESQPGLYFLAHTLGGIHGEYSYEALNLISEIFEKCDAREIAATLTHEKWCDAFGRYTILSTLMDTLETLEEQSRIRLVRQSPYPSGHVSQEMLDDHRARLNSRFTPTRIRIGQYKVAIAIVLIKLFIKFDNMALDQKIKNKFFVYKDFLKEGLIAHLSGLGSNELEKITRKTTFLGELIDHRQNPVFDFFSRKATTDTRKIVNELILKKKKEEASLAASLKSKLNEDDPCCAKKKLFPEVVVGQAMPDSTALLDSVAAGIPVLQSDLLAPPSLMPGSASITMFRNTAFQPISPFAIQYAAIFNRCAYNLFSMTIPEFTKKTIDIEHRPIAKLELWKSALSSEEKNRVLMQARTVWRSRENANFVGIEVPNHTLPTIESELQMNADAVQGVEEGMKLALA